MSLKPFYTYAETGWFAGDRSAGTIRTWIHRDQKLPMGQRRFPNAAGGRVPLGDILKYTGLTMDEFARLVESRDALI